jgi:hypothetical protein
MRRRCSEYTSAEGLPTPPGLGADAGDLRPLIAPAVPRGRHVHGGLEDAPRGPTLTNHQWVDEAAPVIYRSLREPASQATIDTIGLRSRELGKKPTKYMFINHLTKDFAVHCRRPSHAKPDPTDDALRPGLAETVMRPAPGTPKPVVKRGRIVRRAIGSVVSRNLPIPGIRLDCGEVPEISGTAGDKR